MAWGVASRWRRGVLNQALYGELLDDARAAPARNAARRKILHPEDMPWELSRHGLMKHLLNESMNTRMETVDAYMLIIPPGSRSGRHRQLAEECLYVLEGRGYDLHQDCDVEIADGYRWTPQDGIRRHDWQAGDVIYVPRSRISHHYNADPRRPVRLVSAVNRVYRKCGLNDLVQLEDAPEYRPGVTVTPELVAQFLRAPSEAPA
jgi:mannose-6-phosphate isomerase-like protein (cupin superfamily)